MNFFFFILYNNMKSIFIFRRGLRLIDNIGLIEACKKSADVLPIFIFTPEQIDKSKNKYFSNNSVQFLIESLDDLNNELLKRGSRLYYFYGDNVTILKKLKKEYNYDGIYINEDYTPYSVKRDEKIKKMCKKMNISFNSYCDYLLQDVKSSLTKNKEQYKIFTPFYNSIKKLSVKKPDNYICKNFVKKSTNFLLEYKKNIHDFYKVNKNILLNGGRNNKQVKSKINNLKKFKKYVNTRDYPSYNTTNISAINKYGLYSIREIYHIIQKENIEPLLRQLYWREFYYRISYYYPKVLKGYAFKEKYNKIIWNKSTKKLNLWKNGLTGFPMVDAGIRQMNETGWMHNRLRMIVSNFLVKDLFINWKDGEKYFAQKLYDYDPSQNNGGWQWSAGTGTDSQPYFRIFNPWTQSEKWDKNCEYIKKWIPELKDIENKHIHKWYKYYSQYTNINYPKPILNHSIEAKNTIKKYKEYIN